MSGLEILGVVASATQLSAYVLEAIWAVQKLYRQLQDAPKRASDYCEQLLHLEKALELIRDGTIYHTPAIKSHLVSIYQQIKELAELLQHCYGQHDSTSSGSGSGSGRKGTRNGRSNKTLIRWAFLFRGREYQVVRAFDRLKAYQNTLMLCIITIQANRQGETLRAIPNLYDSMQSIERTFQEHLDINGGGNIPGPSEEESLIVELEDQRQAKGKEMNISWNGDSSKQADNSNSNDQHKRGKKESKESTKHRKARMEFHFSNLESNEHAKQLNGPRFHTVEFVKGKQISASFERIIASGSSVQINGPSFG